MGCGRGRVGNIAPKGGGLLNLLFEATGGRAAAAGIYFARARTAQAIVVVQMAKTQALLFGGTENYLVTREFKEMSSREQREDLLHCLFAVAAADGTIDAAEEAVVRQIASELGFTSAEFVTVRAEYSEHREVVKAQRALRQKD